MKDPGFAGAAEHARTRVWGRHCLQWKGERISRASAKARDKAGDLWRVQG